MDPQTKLKNLTFFSEYNSDNEIFDLLSAKKINKYQQFTTLVQSDKKADYCAQLQIAKSPKLSGADFIVYFEITLGKIAWKYLTF